MTIDAHRLGALATAALNELAANPPHMTNKALRAALDLDNDPDTYDEVKEVLLKQGLVAKGVGAGGTLRRVTLDEDPTLVHMTKHELVDPEYPHEADLYVPMQKVIESMGACLHDRDLLATEITAFAKGGSSGSWSHPDITSVQFRSYRYVPGTHIDVVTYEVKPVWAIDVRAVYEALAQRRAATRSYVLLHVPFKDTLTVEPAVTRICETARAHGVGVITAADPADGVTWNEPVPAERHSADPERLDAFLATHLSAKCQVDVADRAHRISMSGA